MKKIIYSQNIYKKWNFVTFLNNLIFWNYQITFKKIWFIKSDFSKNKFWGYKKLNFNIPKYKKSIFSIFFI